MSRDRSEDYIILRKATEAIGPSVGEAGAIDREPDLITIELTEREAVLTEFILERRVQGAQGIETAASALAESARSKFAAALKGNP